jgi:hypothetical protein
MSYFLLGLLFVVSTSFVQVYVPAVPRVLASSTPGNQEP